MNMNYIWIVNNKKVYKMVVIRKNNLFVADGRIYSYDSLIGYYDFNKISIKKEFKKFSTTTSRHINIISKLLNLPVEYI